MTEQPIEQTLALRYAQIVDDRDVERMRDIIAEDFTQVGPNWSCDSADAFLNQLQYVKKRFSATLHMVGNQLGQWSNDKYTGETYTIATHIYENDGEPRKLELGIRYQEEIEKRNDRYCYTRRDVNIVWNSDHPLNI